MLNGDAVEYLEKELGEARKRLAKREEDTTSEAAAKSTVESVDAIMSTPVKEAQTQGSVPGSVSSPVVGLRGEVEEDWMVFESRSNKRRASACGVEDVRRSKKVKVVGGVVA